MYTYLGVIAFVGTCRRFFFTVTLAFPFPLLAGAVFDTF